MTFKRTFLICIIIAVTIKSDKNVSGNGKSSIGKKLEKDYETTREAVKFLSEVEDKLLQKNGTNVNANNKNVLILNDEPNDNDGNNDTNTQSAMENSGLFEGDIMLTHDQAKYIVKEATELLKKINKSEKDNVKNNKRVKRKVTTKPQRRWSFPIKYYVDDWVDSHLIQKAISLIESETCVTFSKTYNPMVSSPGLIYYYGKGCWSYVGNVKKYEFQGISIGRGCSYLGTVAHETLHALGLNHEQNRPDRDSHIRVYFENIDPDEVSNFLKISSLESSTYNVPYDYGSLMQYHLYAFSINRKKTMDPLEPIYEKTLGQNEKLSFADAKIVNLHYCTNKCSKSIKCYNGGYQNPKDCSSCKCVTGFSGRYCDEVPAQTPGCPSSCYNVQSQSQSQSIEVSGEKNCIIHLRTDVGQRIRLKINKSIFLNRNRYLCYSANNLEVKYMVDKTVTGARFCGHDTDVPIVSQNHHIVLMYSSTSPHNNFKVTFNKY